MLKLADFKYSIQDDYSHLHNYECKCWQVNIKSLEDVVRKYLAMADNKTEIARKESHQAVIDIDDLDVLTTPEK